MGANQILLQNEAKMMDTGVLMRWVYFQADL